ncbi:hypothetical protein Bhyg_10939 [Pseudolycoriella hygida]|uniref:Uncharacterized protein n=1 Tax=Pseudolycoriella hygida TaxID=35572 RepID=A0A9Q0RZG6_9DIPT|nr:hypothetical protein Bhyg_10939 [Pseudolycoriella hygida]
MMFRINLICLCSAYFIVSADSSSSETYMPNLQWPSYTFLRFKPPVGKVFYISFIDGQISEYNSTMVAEEDQVSPFISFIGINLKIYNIYFDANDHNCIPRLEESNMIYKEKHHFIRHRLTSFVGPNKKLFKVNFEDGIESNVTISESSETLDKFQIKTLGPYEKWKHTYDISEIGDKVIDHTLSPVPVLSNRSIPLPRLKSDEIERAPHFPFVTFNTPSGTGYHITRQLNIVPNLEDAKVDGEPYITSTENDLQIYDIFVKDGHPFLAKRNMVGNYFGSQRLHSVTGPNNVTYYIDRQNKTGGEILSLVPNPEETSDLQITFEKRKRYHKLYVKYIFADNGTRLFDREDKLDWTILSELPALPIQEISDEDEMFDPELVTFYTPSGNNYRFFFNETTNKTDVMKGSRKENSQSLYISYLQKNGKKANIYLSPDGHLCLESEDNIVLNDTSNFYFLESFVTPDQKEHEINWSNSGNDWFYHSQVKEPVDSNPPEGLKVIIANKVERIVYSFTWTGDKLVAGISVFIIIFIFPGRQGM